MIWGCYTKRRGRRVSMHHYGGRDRSDLSLYSSSCYTCNANMTASDKKVKPYKVHLSTQCQSLTIILRDMVVNRYQMSKEVMMRSGRDEKKKGENNFWASILSPQGQFPRHFGVSIVHEVSCQISVLVLCQGMKTRVPLYSSIRLK